jgi:Protein of unknown function (DUF3800)
MGSKEFSDYIVYVDDSGDHSLSSINPQNPVFVLVFCIFEKDVYRTSVVPAVQKLKFDFWGHDCIILHGHDIRKRHEDFRILMNENIRKNFIHSVNVLVEQQDFTIIAAAIDKNKHIGQYAVPKSPYAIALTFCLERLQYWLREKGQDNKLTHVLVEKRGRKEDVELMSEFQRIAQGNNMSGKMPNLDIRFMNKKHNSAGLQIADIVAHPIGRHVINPLQDNRAFDIIEPKFRRGPKGMIKGYGLKIFP